MENNIKLCKMTCRIEFNTGPGTRDNSVECNSTLDGEGLNVICCYWASLDQLNPAYWYFVGGTEENLAYFSQNKSLCPGQDDVRSWSVDKWKGKTRLESAKGC